MKVIVKGRENRDQLEIFSIEGFVPADHLLRKIDSAVDFSHIYDIVEDLYCADNGRPSIDPVVIFKMVLIQHLYGLPSLRRTVEEIKMNVAYRWFLGYLMNEQIPHFSTVSYNFKHRYTEKTIEEIFYWILNEIETAGYLSPEAVFVDGTHIKANANLKKAVKKAVPQAAKIYEKQLMEEINEERNDHGKKPFDETKPPEEKEISESTTDPESGVFHKGEHKKCFAYTAQTGCDKNGYVMDVTVNPGNVHDSVAFDGLYDRLAEKNPEIKAVVADAGYKTPWISKRILDDGRIPVLPYKRPMSKKGFFPPYEYVYDEYFNCVICPENQVLSYATTNREGYREFKSKGYICENCPSRHLCTENRKFEKTVTKHIWSDYLETVEDIRHTPEYKALYERRKETIERVFADAKEKYAMRYTPYRGLSQVTNWVRLKFATMNLKKYALHRWKRSHQYSALINLYTFFAKTKLITLNLAWNLGLFDRLNRCPYGRRFYFRRLDMQSKLDLIEKLDNELIKYMKLQGKSELKLMLDALELYMPIRSNLKAMPLAEPNIAALLNTPDLLLAIDVIKEKFYKDCPAPDCTEFTFKLVNEVYRNERAKLLAAKVQNENAAHKNELKTLPPEEIIDRAFQTNIYNDYEIMLSEPDLMARQIDTLMTYPNILNSLYVEWICGSYVHTDELEDCLKKCIEDQDIYLQGNPDCGVDKGEKEIWDKMYEGDEFRVPLNCEAADKEAGEELEP